MEFRRILAAAALLWVGGLSPQAFAGQSKAPVAETYTVKFEIKGEPAVAQIVLFPGSPLDNPKFKEQIKKLHADHVLFIDDEEGQKRAPSAEGDLEKAKAMVQDAGVDTETVKPPKGFYKAMTSSARQIFTNPDIKPGDSSLQSGLISVFSGRLIYVAGVVAKNKMSLLAGLPIFIAQGLMTFSDNYFNLRIRSYLKDNWYKPGIRADARVATQIARGMIYKGLYLEFAKAFEPTFRAATDQWNILGNVFITTPLEVLIANTLIHAFTGTVREIESKVARVNLVLFGFGGIFNMVDQLDPGGMKIISMGAYDFKVSGALLLGYYGFALYKLRTNPEIVLKWCNQVANAVAWPFRRIGAWFKPKSAPCDNTYQKQLPAREDPPSNSDNESPAA
ncbi:MAG: hypothetical protein JST80_01895 [Bdellovibrionales bacterium]|nr:hypothetical protein [Bdellovibrionales bacterium]